MKATRDRTETTQHAATDAAGVTWQPFFVLGMIVLGVLVILAKILGLF